MGTCGMMVVENYEVSSSPHFQSSLSIPSPPLWFGTSTSESFWSRSSQFSNSVSVSYEILSYFWNVFQKIEDGALCQDSIGDPNLDVVES